MNIHSLKIIINKWLNLNSIFNLVLIVLMVVLIFIPSAKAYMIRGLMEVGLFRPDVSETIERTTPTKDVTFQDKDGKQISISALKGKVLFINFWTTWCPPCIAELPSINELHGRLKDHKEIVFIIADADNNFAKSIPFINSYGYSLPIYEAVTAVPKSMLGDAIPATVVIDKQGKIVFRHDGVADYSRKKFNKFLIDLAQK